MWLTPLIDRSIILAREGWIMSGKGVLIALFCAIGGGILAFFSLRGFLHAYGSPLWLALLIVSFIAMLFGVGALSSRIQM